MIHLGKKEEFLQTNFLIPLTIIDKPTKFPLLGKDEYVVCCYAQGLDKFLIICENLKDMQLLYKKFEQGWICQLKWYYATIYFV